MVKQYLVTISHRFTSEVSSNSVSYFSTAVSPAVANIAAQEMAKTVFPSGTGGKVYVCVEEQQPRTLMGRLLGL